MNLDEIMFNDQPNDDLEVIAEKTLEIKKILNLLKFFLKNNGDIN